MVKMPPGPEITRGLDTSHWDGPIDFAAVMASGREFCYQKCTEYNADNSYRKNMANAKLAGLVWGAYHFFHPSKDPASQANLFISIANLQRGDMIPILDWEVTDNIPSKTDRSRAKIWLDIIEKRYGKPPMIYIGPYFAKALTLTADWARYPLIVAHYQTSAPLVPAPWPNWTFWQYTDKGDVPGIPAPDEDLDTFNGTIAMLRSRYTI